MAEMTPELYRRQFEDGFKELCAKTGNTFLIDTIHSRVIIQDNSGNMSHRHEIQPVMLIVLIDGWQPPVEDDIEEDKVKDGDD